MEQRGSGFGRMKDFMLNHGLKKPEIDMEDGYFQIILYGPGENIGNLRIPKEKATEFIKPSVEHRLNKRQKKMAELLAQGEKLTSRYCEDKFGVSRDTTSRDFNLLIELDIAEARGKGRSRHYVYKGKG
jgi:ATP-dependent DNA helicase RecG